MFDAGAVTCLARLSDKYYYAPSIFIFAPLPVCCGLYCHFKHVKEVAVAISDNWEQPQLSLSVNRGLHLLCIFVLCKQFFDVSLSTLFDGTKLCQQFPQMIPFSIPRILPDAWTRCIRYKMCLCCFGFESGCLWTCTPTVRNTSYIMYVSYLSLWFAVQVEFR